MLEIALVVPYKGIVLDFQRKYRHFLSIFQYLLPQEKKERLFS